MKIKFGENKEFRQGYTKPNPGYFALDVESPKTPHWDHCREQFAVKFTESTDGFYFSHDPGQNEAVAGFIFKTEEILDLINLNKPWEFSTYNKTDKDTILWINPSKFWRFCEMKRSLLTILLRCGMSYNPQIDNYEDALFGNLEFKLPSHEYTEATRPAIIRFLFGFTTFVPTEIYSPITSGLTIHKCGWLTVFKERNNAEVRKMLVLPDGETPVCCPAAADSLWI